MIPIKIKTKDLITIDHAIFLLIATDLYNIYGFLDVEHLRCMTAVDES